MSPNNEKSHVSNIWYKAYMGKTIICCTLTMSTIIIVLYLCMVTVYTCIGNVWWSEFGKSSVIHQTKTIQISSYN